jgi:hypothetical protein
MPGGGKPRTLRFVKLIKNVGSPEWLAFSAMTSSQRRACNYLFRKFPDKPCLGEFSANTFAAV